MAQVEAVSRKDVLEREVSLQQAEAARIESALQKQLDQNQQLIQSAFMQIHELHAKVLGCPLPACAINMRLG
jgi:hypothetical protein